MRAFHARIRRYAELREPRFASHSTLREHRKHTKMLWFQELGHFFDATAAPVMRWGSGDMKEDVMRNLLLTAATSALLLAAVPASAQVYMGADPYGAGVQVGPFGFGVGPRYDYGWRGNEYYAYGADCPLVRERVHTPDGRVIVKTHRACR
jgi:hypothetical protein